MSEDFIKNIALARAKKIFTRNEERKRKTQRKTIRKRFNF